MMGLLRRPDLPARAGAKPRLYPANTGASMSAVLGRQLELVLRELRSLVLTRRPNPRALSAGAERACL